MKKANNYVRRTISLSPKINDLLSEGAKNEFGGNLSAFLAHITLDYFRCKNCEKRMRKKANAKKHNCM